MDLQIRNTKTDKDTFVNCIVYGQSGIGKTSLVKNMPIDDTLVLSAEDGLLSVRDAGVNYVVVRSVDDVMNVLDKVKKTQFKNIVIDSITELSQNHYTYLRKKYNDPKKNLQLWGQYAEDFSAMFKELRALEKNIIAIALEKEKQDDAGKIYYAPSLYGSMVEKIIAWFDIVVRYLIKDGERVFLTSKTERSLAKDRSGKLEMLEKPNICNLIKKVLGE